MPTIAIMTDFGIKDGNVGVMKGVIWGICPDARIADVSHMIGPQNLQEASIVLARSAPYFPAGTVQLAVVDPGVGTSRRPMAARIGPWFYVGPDNGTITLWLERALVEKLPIEFAVLDRPAFWLPQVSHVFHGRDIFAPVAAHLARGVPFFELGTAFTDPVVLDFPEPQRGNAGWRGQVIYIDHFGNIAANIRVENLGPALLHKESVVVHIGSMHVHGLVNAFGDRLSGDVIALLGSTGNLIVSVVNGDAAATLRVKVGDTVEVSVDPVGPQLDGKARP